MLCILLILACGKDLPLSGQTGCGLIDEAAPAQYVVFESLEEGSGKKADGPKVVLRLRNNSECDISFHIDALSSRQKELVTTPDGYKIIGIQGLDDVPDGGRLGGLRYEVKYRQSKPPVKKTLYQANDMIDVFRLRRGLSVSFTVPLSVFDRWVHVEVPFSFIWDEATAKHDRNKSWRPPFHGVFIGNEDLPADVFRRTELCSKVEWCKKP